MELFSKKSPSEKLGISPDAAFIQNTKVKFLAAFDARYGTRESASKSAFMIGFRIAAGALAVFAIVASASVYADTRNVPPDSALYSFKRLGESMQLIFASQVEKPQLQANFAVRRADEITELQTREPSSTALVKLNNDLDSAINASINAQAKIDAGDKNGKGSNDGMSADFCAKFLSTVGSFGSAAHDALLSHPKIIQKLERQCGQDDETENATVAPSSTDNAAATTSINMNEDNGDSKDSHGGGKDGGLLNVKGGEDLKVGIE